MNFAVPALRTTVAVALLALTVVATPASAGELDQSQPMSSGSALFVNVQQSVGQSFNAGISGMLDRVDVETAIKSGDPGPLTVQIRNMTDDGPGTSILASTTIPSVGRATWPNMTWASATFDDPANVRQGGRYAIVLAAGNGPWDPSETNPQWLAAIATDDVAPGSIFRTTGPPDRASWFDDAGYDLAYKTYVATGPVDGIQPSLAISHAVDGANGWNTSAAVDVAISASDGETGIASPPRCTDNGHSLRVRGAATPYAATVAGDDVHTIACEVNDRAGNVQTSTEEVMIDTLAPTVSAVPSNGGYVYLDWPYAPICDAEDHHGSGVATRGSVSSGLTTPPTDVGDFTFTCDGAMDVAGNKAAWQTFSFHVYYPWPDGFLTPIDNLDFYAHYIQNEAKAGSTIPLKFSLGGTDRGMDILASDSPASVTVPCDSTLPTDPVEEYATTSVAGLNYEPGQARYTYNWKTSSDWAGSCRQFLLKLRDGATHEARFKFVK